MGAGGQSRAGNAAAPVSHVHFLKIVIPQATVIALGAHAAPLETYALTRRDTGRCGRVFR